MVAGCAILKGMQPKLVASRDMLAMMAMTNEKALTANNLEQSAFLPFLIKPFQLVSSRDPRYIGPRIPSRLGLV